MTSTTPRVPHPSDRILHDEDGRLAVWQRPNLPIIVWLAARLAELVVRHGRPARLLDVIAYGALFTWSWLEVFDGDSYFRRALGLAVLVGLLVNRSWS